MSQYLAVASKKSGGKIDITPRLTEIKDYLSLAGKTNQKLNQYRRNIIKRYLSPQFKKLGDISGDSKRDILEKKREIYWRYSCRCSRVPVKGKLNKILVKR